MAEGFGNKRQRCDKICHKKYTEHTQNHSIRETEGNKPSPKTFACLSADKLTTLLTSFSSPNMDPGLWGSDDEEKKQKKENSRHHKKPTKTNGHQAETIGLSHHVHENAAPTQKERNIESNQNGTNNDGEEMKVVEVINHHEKRRRRRKARQNQEHEEEIKENPVALDARSIKIISGANENEVDIDALIESEYENPTSGLTFDEKVEWLTKENDDGKIEYKWKLVNPTADRIEHLTTQMKYRLQEGNGDAMYEIGVADNGKPIGLNKEEMITSLSTSCSHHLFQASQTLLETLCYMASKLKADVVILKMKKGQGGKIAEVMVRENQREGIKLDLRIMVVGEEGVGKSTLVCDLYFV